MDAEDLELLSTESSEGFYIAEDVWQKEADTYHGMPPKEENMKRRQRGRPKASAMQSDHKDIPLFSQFYKNLTDSWREVSGPQIHGSRVVWRDQWDLEHWGNFLKAQPTNQVVIWPISYKGSKVSAYIA
ncbi:hypothetical protein BS47DRAFT_1364494 [Hydnum rufescens UP504]|uniref:Uncharacterized protein n=1 Tax=Hydnum rufescens UP504 TaxID=1448309 RepID=A0A9P6ATC9_9AGAM|nr:hypothetical protein BS47DRAFT_1364494 [Hydnum rufescens UP504]